MALFGLFQNAKREDPPVNPAALKSLEDKIDRLLQELNISVADAGDGLPPAVRQHLDRGDKLSAIQTYRQLTHVGLAEAKEAVENGAVNPIRRMERKMNWVLEGLGCVPPPPVSSRPPSSAIERQIEDLLNQGNKIHAIRLYHKHFRTSLSDAKDAVERIEQRRG